jgi:cytochrome c nitrite reductase small subunit
MIMSRPLVLLLSALVGAVGGVGGYAFIYAKGYSYLLNDPSACANCYVMRGQYDAWASLTPGCK